MNSPISDQLRLSELISKLDIRNEQDKEFKSKLVEKNKTTWIVSSINEKFDILKLAESKGLLNSKNKMDLQNKLQKSL